MARGPRVQFVGQLELFCNLVAGVVWADLLEGTDAFNGIGTTLRAKRSPTATRP